MLQYNFVWNAIGYRRTRKEAERRCGYNGRYAPYAAIAFRPACVPCPVERKLGVFQLWRSDRRERRSHIEKRPLIACRDSDLRSNAYSVALCAGRIWNVV